MKTIDIKVHANYGTALLLGILFVIATVPLKMLGEVTLPWAIITAPVWIILMKEFLVPPVARFLVYIITKAEAIKRNKR